MNLRILFAISVTVFFISFMIILFLSPELTIGLTKLSWIPDELDPEQLKKAQEILKKCDIPNSEFDRINDVLFTAEKEFYLNNDTVKAENLFKTVKKDIIQCTIKSDGGTLFLDTVLGKTSEIVAIISGITSTVILILGFKKHGKDFL